MEGLPKPIFSGLSSTYTKSTKSPCDKSPRWDLKRSIYPNKFNILPTTPNLARDLKYIDKDPPITPTWGFH